MKAQYRNRVPDIEVLRPVKGLSRLWFIVQTRKTRRQIAHARASSSRGHLLQGGHGRYVSNACECQYHRRNTA
jgi:hypothetical protein